MNKIFLLFFTINLIFIGCEKPTEIKEIPSDYIGNWQGKISMQFRKNINATLSLEKDSMNILYEEFDTIYKIKCIVEKIEKSAKQECSTCKDEVLTLYYVVEDAETKEQTPYIDKLWLDGKSKNAYNLLHIDQSEMYKGNIKTWTRVK